MEGRLEALADRFINRSLYRSSSSTRSSTSNESEQLIKLETIKRCNKQQQQGQGAPPQAPPTEVAAAGANAPLAITDQASFFQRTTNQDALLHEARTATSEMVGRLKKMHEDHTASSLFNRNHQFSLRF